MLKNKRILLILAASAILSACGGGGTSNNSSPAPAPAPTPAPIPEQVFAAGNIGGSLNIITSTTNGASWSSSFLAGTTLGLSTIAVGNGVWVTAGNTSGVVLVSTDGINFVPISLVGNSGNIRTIYFDGSKFLLGTSTGAIYYSNASATTWTPAISNPGIDINGITKGDGLYVAVGGSRYSTSKDGINWSDSIVIPTASNLSSIVYDATDSLFIASDRNNNSNSIFTSPVSSIAWTPRTIGFPLNVLATDNSGNTVGFGGSQISGNLRGVTSSNGITWGPVTPPSPAINVSVFGATYDSVNNKFVIVGSTTPAPGRIVVLNNTSASNWSNPQTTVSSAASTNSSSTAGVASAGGKTYFVTDSNIPGGIFYTTDYTSYSNSISGFTINQMISTPAGILATGNTVLFNSTSPILKSTDKGATWSLTSISGLNSQVNTTGPVALGPIANLNGNNLVIRGRFRGGESNSFYTSSDGSTWTSVVSPIGFESSLTYSPNRLIAANNLFVLATTTSGSIAENAIHTSSDGTTWTLRTSPNAQINDIIYANGSFVAVGNGGLILQSADGITWNNISTPQYGAINFSKIVYANGLYSIQTSGANYNSVLTSSNLITWLPLSGDVDWPISTLYTANSSYFAFIVGAALVNGDINNLANQSSAVRLNSSFVFGGGFQFTSVSQ